MELERKYSFIRNYEKRAVYISFFRNVCGSFSVYSNIAICKCRGPPFINLKKTN